MTDFKTTFKGYFSAIETMLGGVDSLAQVVNSREPVLKRFPCALIEPGEVTLEAEDMNELTFNVLTDWEVIVVIKEIDGSQVFAKVIDELGDILDAVLADDTIGGVFRATRPNKPTMKPGSVEVAGDVYHGGSIRFKSLSQYTYSA